MILMKAGRCSERWLRFVVTLAVLSLASCTTGSSQAHPQGDSHAQRWKESRCESRSASGDLAYESNTFTITDKAGKKIDSGKYVTVFARKDGKWVIVRDIWNSDAGPATP